MKTCPHCGGSLEVNKDKITFDGLHFVGIETIAEYLARQFPAVDIRSEIAKMEAWLFSNPKNRKSNYKRFIVNWLTRAQDRSPRVEKFAEASIPSYKRTA